jgi:hypothetical protein
MALRGRALAASVLVSIFVLINTGVDEVGRPLVPEDPAWVLCGLAWATYVQLCAIGGESERAEAREALRFLGVHRRRPLRLKSVKEVGEDAQAAVTRWRAR